MQFVNNGISQQSNGAYTKYLAYRNNFLKDVALYMKNNLEIITPLIDKMRVIQ